MKFDEVRAWKDEAYREILSDEQIAHPSGALADEDLAEVFGGDGPYDGNDAAAAASSSCTSNNALTSRRCHSWALLCDINLFSADVHVITLDHLIGIGASE